MAGYAPRISTDRFGNKYQVIGCKDKKETGFPKGYIELGNKLYKLEPSKANKDGIDVWIKVTEVKKRSTNASM
jgi:hypothetical protein